MESVKRCCNNIPSFPCSPRIIVGDGAANSVYQVLVIFLAQGRRPLIPYSEKREHAFLDYRSVKGDSCCSGSDDVGHSRLVISTTRA